MKHLIVTRCDNSQSEMARISHPLIKEYARKCNADFGILDKGDDVGVSTHYRILKFYDLFEKYDRILSVDTDVIIRKDTPNIFDIVPPNMVGTIYEDKGSREQERLRRIKQVQTQFGDVGWKHGYINTGFALFSREHRIIFEPSDVLYDGYGYDDVWLGYKIVKYKKQVFELDPRLNFMSMFTEPWCGMRKSDAFVLHYAGKGFIPYLDRVEQMKRDLYILRRYGIV
ncbi:hypothetical protein DRJ17_06690 [Candidatus Woesearchaeota archaeon]|mgnify:CR=1 FL=1|nr:MAG: hypothetical protein DRJ17_06690 [Candidatus Woesearchaeota archaeon]